MADTIGVLAVVANVTQATHTAYTVPTGKAAKVKLMYRGAAGASSTLSVAINGITIFQMPAATSGHVKYSSTAKMYETATAANAITGASDALTVAPGPKEYYLSEGDTVTYTIGTADFGSMSFQVVGVEVDV